MKFIGNIIWLVFGGILISILYLIGSLLLIITIIGIPFGLQTLKLANLTLWPFGRNAVYRSHEPGCLGTFMNILWILEKLPNHRFVVFRD